MKARSKSKGLIKVFILLDNWWVYLKDYLGIYNKEDITYKLRDGRLITLKTNNGIARGLFNEIFVYEEYCEDKNFKIEKGFIVFDIGANVGMFSIYCKDAKKVYAFEPVSENFKALEENILKNPIKNIEAINKAVSSKNGTQKIYLSKNIGAHTLIKESLSKNFREPEGVEMVETISLEDFIKNNKIDRIDFLKMDCEGSEFEILYSLPKEIFEKINRISLETHKFGEEADVDKLASFLQNMGFEIKRAQEKELFYSRMYAIKPSIKDVRKSKE